MFKGKENNAKFCPLQQIIFTMKTIIILWIKNIWKYTDERVM